MTDRSGWISGALRDFERPLIRYAARLLGDVDAARDVVQDCFLRLCRQKPGDVDGHVKQWLYTVCRNRSIDLLRKAGRMETLDGKTSEITREDTRPDRDLAQREEAGRVAARVAALPALQRDVLRLKFQDGLSYKQIAAVTETTVSNVGFLLHTALRTLRSQLAPRSQA